MTKMCFGSSFCPVYLVVSKKCRTFVPDIRIVTMKAFFFDMDGTLFDSMPRHARAWEQVMAEHGLSFPQVECFRNEGRTGADVIAHAIRTTFHREPSEEEIRSIYQEKTERFRAEGDTLPIPGVAELLRYLHERRDIWIGIVTGSGQQSLFDTLNRWFPAVFARERMITAFDVTRGKPDPEPYIKAWQRSGVPKADCFVVENAPLGVRSAKAAGLTCYAVNTGPLPDADLWNERADEVFPDMKTFYEYLKTNL